MNQGWSANLDDLHQTPVDGLAGNTQTGVLQHVHVCVVELVAVAMSLLDDVCPI